MCVCVKERDRDREKERDRETMSASLGKARVSTTGRVACVYVFKRGKERGDGWREAMDVVCHQLAFGRLASRR